MTFTSSYDAMHEQAMQATGLSDFGSTDYIAPLKMLLSDYDQHNRFTEAGTQVISGGLVGLLVGRLITQQSFKSYPEFAAAEIKRPIIIFGLPRTGTTALHKLLAKDPDNQWLAPWLGSAPVPRPPRETWESHPSYQAMVNGLEQFYKLSPQNRSMHPINASEPDECRFGLEHAFWAPSIAFTAHMPEYGKWIFEGDIHPVYERYRKILGVVAGGDTRRWLLKDPTTHLFVPQTVVDTFPDACFVYTHRDPVSAMTSVSNMIYQFRHGRDDALTPEQNGCEQLAVWGRAVARTEEVFNQLGPERVVDVHMNELNDDPVGTAERIYRHFNLPVSEQARQSWQRHADVDARVGHGVHHHSLENCGFSADDVNANIGAYREKYQRLYGTSASPRR